MSKPLTDEQVDALKLAVAGVGEYAFTWRDKPHRLIYDAVNEIKRLRAELDKVNEMWIDRGNSLNDLGRELLRFKDELFAAKAELAEERARLDWVLCLIEQNSMYIVRGHEVAVNYDDGWWYRDEHDILRRAATGRAAIDAARKAGKP